MFAIALIGTAAITAQILLVRELINIFSGNELIYGLTIFLWLILYSCGSGILGRLSQRIENKLIIFILFQGALALLLPAEIYLTRTIKNLFGIPFGALVDLPTNLFIIILVLAPLTLILGFQFALGSTLLTENLKKGSSQIIRVYFFEMIGSILGGLFFTYILIFFLNAFQIAAVLILLISVSFQILGWNLPRKKIFCLGSGLLIIGIAVLTSAAFLDKLSTQQGIKDFRLIETADSPYGRITITERYDSFNFYENGTLLFSSTDQLSHEEIAHLSLLMHPDPKKVLLIGGGASGITNELLKYPINLDILELDYKIIELARKMGKLDPKQNILTMDGVKYVKETDRKYDLILVNLPDPTTANINRFYTLEFFKSCKDRLAKGGILTFSLETSESYMGRELKLLNQSIFKTVSRLFKYITVVPGSKNYYFASESRLLEDRSQLLKRWEARNIRTDFFRANSLYFILWPDKIRYVKEAIEFDDKTPLNTEFKPVSYYFGLLLWASYFYSPVKNFFYTLMQTSFPNLLFTLIAVLLAIKFISLKIKRVVLPTVITLLGFTGMCAQLIIIYAFQSFYGYVYQTIGLLTTVFMAGLAAGSFLVYRQYDQIKDPSKMLKNILWLLLLNITLIFMLLKVIPLPLAPFLISLPIGAAFPLAVKIHEKYRSEIGSLAGILYGADLLGGALAAIMTTILLIPVFGILNTFLIAIALAVGALLISYS